MGSLEASVLYAVARDSGDAYGVSIGETIHELTGEDIAMGAIYATLDRLERKGCLRSCWSEPTAERGGRRKRLFEITGVGERALAEYDQHFRHMSAGWKSVEPPLKGAKA